MIDVRYIRAYDQFSRDEMTDWWHRFDAITSDGEQRYGADISSSSQALTEEELRVTMLALLGEIIRGGDEAGTFTTPPREAGFDCRYYVLDPTVPSWTPKP